MYTEDLGTRRHKECLETHQDTEYEAQRVVKTGVNKTQETLNNTGVFEDLPYVVLSKLPILEQPALFWESSQLQREGKLRLPPVSPPETHEI